MAKLIASPVVVPAAGNPPKLIEEFVGLVASRTPKAPAIRDRTSASILSRTSGSMSGARLR